jgi:rhodanese-related sulfurtransferase
MRPWILVCLLCDSTALTAAPPTSTSAAVCTACHAASAKTLRGYLGARTPRAHTLRVELEGTSETLSYDPATLKVQQEGKTLPASALPALPRGQAVRVEVAERRGRPVATLVSVKPQVRLTAPDLISAAELRSLVALGPELGNYHLFDARPPARFQEGTIPTAMNLPFTEFDAKSHLLPADKEALVIFFCQGTACNMGPCALARARELGYTRARVFREGMTAWYAQRPGVTTPAGFKAAFLDENRPVVILDLRPTERIREGFIPGAVAAAPDSLKPLLATGFPPARLRPPVLIVDENGGPVASEAALEVVKAGYLGVNVLEGGYRAWRAALLPVEAGDPAVAVAWAPRVRPGTISGDEFTRIANLPPKARGEVLILDVRNRSDARQGMIRGALNVPHDELEGRLKELPRNRRILVHCGSGALAESAYRTLVTHGFEAAYLDGEITILETGEFVVD